MAKVSLTTLILLDLYIGLLAVLAVFGNPFCAPGSSCKHEIDRLQSSLDKSIKPCDDFYKFACGNFGNSSSTVYDSTFIRRKNKFIVRVNELLNSSQSTPNSLAINNCYKTCQSFQEESNPQELINFIRNIISDWTVGRHLNVSKPWTELYLDTLVYGGVPVIFDIEMISHPEQKILLNKVLFLTIEAERTHGLTPQEKWIGKYATYIQRVARLFELSNSEEELSQDAQDLATLEYALIASRFDGKLSTSVTADMVAHVFGLNKLLLDPLARMLNVSQTNSFAQMPVVVDNPRFWNLHKTLTILNNASSNLLGKFFGWQIMQRYAPLMNATVLTYLEDYYADITSSPETISNCRDSVMNILEMAVFRQYIDRFMNAQKRTEVLSLALQIRSSLQYLLRTSKLITNSETRTYLIEKLQTAKIDIGYPNWITVDYLLNQYYGLDDPETLVGVLSRRSYLEKGAILKRATLRYRFSSLRPSISTLLYQPEQKWPIKFSDVSARFFRKDDWIVVPATVLQAPFYDQNRPFFSNYAITGSLIANNFAHLIDLYYNQLFELLPGELQMKCFDDEISELVSRTGQKIPSQLQNFNFAQGELISDLISLHSAYFAYKRHSDHATTRHLLRYPGLESYSTDQLFFIAYAQSMCEVNRPAVWIENKLAASVRFNLSLSDFKEFSQTFNCPVGTPMNPSKKCSVWN